jgi:hypothetical protein
MAPAFEQKNDFLKKNCSENVLKVDQKVGEREKREEPLRLICAKGSTFDKENELLPCSSVFRQRTLPPFQFFNTM